METNGVEKLSALAHPARLRVFRLLVRRAPDRMPAGELARALDLPASTLSTYLAQLRLAGLVTEERKGPSRLYAADTSGADDLVAYLIGECCRGRAASCLSSVPRGEVPPRRFRVLFICTGNSARSVMAETLLRDLGAERFEVHSAGTRPFPELNPTAVEMLQANGHDISRLRPKSVAEFQGQNDPGFDFVFTVCDRAANEECPAWPGQPVSAHWGQPDPVRAGGTEAERMLAFQSVYAALRNRIAAFAALPIEALDRATLQQRVDAIARFENTEPA